MKNTKQNKLVSKKLNQSNYVHCLLCNKSLKSIAEPYPLCDACWISSSTRMGHGIRVPGGKMTN